MIELFAHNKAAYDRAVKMLASRGKAAVIHPTGTGKSFIAFKLAEDNSFSRLLWLSPSEYIFRTQLENIKAACGYEPRNIKFLTYAKLMQMNGEEIAELVPSYIILDEFHRCGAEMWGKGVEQLFNTYTSVPVLGLSATSIRYLDNRRDMADELFDGCVASEMTLGEAVVTGILTPPEYVLSIYSCAKEIEKYQSRVRRAKTKATQDEAQKKLDALRRSLENAEGLDAVFSKHIKDREGKYIVFCSSVEHLRETESRVNDWFGKIDKYGLPSVYKAYAEDETSSKAFDAFRKDTSEHLKLLLCIDMLNEGIHVEGISGVILLRPTISPIVYKQQIGRALSSGKSHKNSKNGNHDTVPVIIDIVNNIENLYSISAVQQEMSAAINYYRATGQENKIINESFVITDETKDSRRLFCELEETLSASWETMYQKAKAYYDRHGNIDLSKRYVTEEGYALGSWLFTQRQIRAGKIHGVLTQERIQKLDAIAMDWQNKYDRAWDKYYNALCKYRYDNGNIDIKANYVTDDGVELGAWIANLRAAKNSRRKGYYLTDERVLMLDKLGMIWDKIDYQWEKNYSACVEYYKQHHNLDIPANYVTSEGLRVGAWIARTRRQRDGRLKGAAKLTEEQIARLDAIAMDWQDSYTKRWEYGYEKAREYHAQHGDLNVPANFVTQEGYPLGKWLRRQSETSDKTTKTTEERKAKLAALGYSYDKDKEETWDRRIEACEKYRQEHGDLDIPQHYVTTDGTWLGKWLYECKRAYRGEACAAVKPLTKEQIQGLEALGIDWRSRSERAWEEKYKAAAEMLEKMHQAAQANDAEKQRSLRAKYPPSHSLRQWLVRQRGLMRQGKLTDEQVSKLGALAR